MERVVDQAFVADLSARLETAFADSREQLALPFLLVVVGEFNAGKSAFINALLGARVLEEGGHREPGRPVVDSRHRVEEMRDGADAAGERALRLARLGDAVATDEPDVAANRAQQPMLVCSRPPGSRPSQADSAMYMRSAMPDRSSSSPISTKYAHETADAT